MSTRRTTGVRLRDRVPFGRGAAFGVGAYVAGYLLTYCVLAFDKVRAMNHLDESPVGLETFVGWAFYAAQFVPLRVETGDGGESVDLLAVAAGLDAPTAAYHLVPAATLFVAGYLVVRTSEYRFLGSGTAMAAGASVVAGYLPLAALGTALFRVNAGSGSTFVSVPASGGPAIVGAVVLAGLAFPLVAGGLGGAGGYILDRAAERSTASRGPADTE